MALKVIGAGFGRTGTWSTKAALNELGLPCYHMSEVVLNKENKSHLDFWRKVANSPPGATQDWKQVFAKYQATVDNPAVLIRILETIRRIAPRMPEEGPRRALRDEADAVWEAVASGQVLVGLDRKDVEAAWQRAQTATEEPTSSP